MGSSAPLPLELVLASGNAKKLRELQTVLGGLGVRVLSPSDIGGLPDVVEDRETFEGNARKKAESAAAASGRWCLADDSGLEVDALGGAPGVLSARFAGEHGDDAANNAKLLAALDGLAPEQRGARFVCVLALAGPEGRTRSVAVGHSSGRILDAPRGTGGFGYDPLFLFTEEGHAATGKVFAELTPDEKASVSHRGRALQELARRLPSLVA